MKWKLIINKLLVLLLFIVHLKSVVFADEGRTVMEAVRYTISSQIDAFKDALEDAIEVVLREIDETHKNLLISSQNVINEALNNKELDLFKKANLALRYMSLIKGKDDITQKSSHNLFKYAELGRF